MQGRFNWKRYGSLIRMRRYEMGYRHGDNFIKNFHEKLPTMSCQTLYKIERGDQSPSVEQFISLNESLYGSPIPPADVMKMFTNF